MLMAEYDQQPSKQKWIDKGKDGNNNQICLTCAQQAIYLGLHYTTWGPSQTLPAI